MDNQITQWAKETQAAGRRYDNEWDLRAVSWPTLPQNATVLELGTYKGRWGLQMFINYPTINYIGFEPQEWAYNTAYKVLEPYNARLYNYGLGYDGGILPLINHGTDGCKFGTYDDLDIVTAEKRPLIPTFMKLGIDHIDLMMVNIEGGEYEVIPTMLNAGIKPDRIVVQFHEGDYHGLVNLIDSHYPVKLWDYGKTLTAWGAS